MKDALGNDLGALVLLEHFEVGVHRAPATDYTFDVPQEFEDLILVTVARSSNVSGSYSLLRFNDDAGSNYNRANGLMDGVPQDLNGGSNATSTTFAVAGRCAVSSWPSGVYAVNEATILNYRRDKLIKHVVGESVYRFNDINFGGLAREFHASHWRKTPPEAIRRLLVWNSNVEFYVAGSTFSLYGRG